MNVLSSSLVEFVDKLIAEKNFTDVPEEALADMKQELLTRLEDRINATILANLPEDKLEEFEVLLDTGTVEDTQALVMKALPNLEQILAEDLIKFRDTYLGTEKTQLA